MKQLSENFSLMQLIASDTAAANGIDNAPPPELIGNLERLAAGLEAVQALLQAPLEISSGYRCPELNRSVGGSERSQHVDGMAADFTCADFGPPMAVAAAIRASGIPFDQCILEFNRWVHISFSQSPRGRMLSIYDGAQGYLDGLCDPDGKPVA